MVVRRCSIAGSVIMNAYLDKLRDRAISGRIGFGTCP